MPRRRLTCQGRNRAILIVLEARGGATRPNRLVCTGEAPVKGRSGLCAICMALGACATRDPPHPPRDWAAHPAVLRARTGFAARPIYAVSDVHGGYDRFRALLV